MIYFKYGKMATKAYNLADQRMIYLKTGDYILDCNNKILVKKDDGELIDLYEFELLQFFHDLNIDSSRDTNIDLYLDRRGRFCRKDSIKSRSSIETLFAQYSFSIIGKE